MSNSQISSPESLDPHKIAIIGGRKSGKTTLCASLHQSLIAGSHGFSPYLVARFPDAAGLHQLETLFTMKFSSASNLFRAETGAPVNKIRVGIDFTASRWSMLNRDKHILKGYYPIEIDDLRDDFDLLGTITRQPSRPDITRTSTDLATLAGETAKQLTRSLSEAETLIICHPAGQRLAPSEQSGFIRLMSDIAIGRYGRFERIVIAFTKYEQLFLKKGVRAFANATRPESILKTIRQTVRADHALESGLSGLNGSGTDSPDLYAVPVSAFGFIRHNGAANFDRLTNTPISALIGDQTNPSENPLKDAQPKTKIAGFTIPIKKAEQTDYPDEISPPHPGKHWLPFLTADPFLTAISGVPSKFMIPFGQFLDSLKYTETNAQHRRSA